MFGGLDTLCPTPLFIIAGMKIGVMSQYGVLKRGELETDGRLTGTLLPVAALSPPVLTNVNGSYRELVGVKKLMLLPGHLSFACFCSRFELISNPNLELM